MSQKYLSPSQLNGFLNCNYHRINFEKGVKKKKITFSLDALFKRGIEHEKNYLKELKKNKKKIVVINTEKGQEKKAAKETEQAIKDGADLIYQGCLIKDNWIGLPDFLVKVEDKNNKYHYEVTDTKISSKAKVDHIMQTSAYADFLRQYQNGILGEKIHIVLKDFKKDSFSTNETMKYFLINKEYYENFLNSKAKDKIKPIKCSYCTFCDYQETCHEQWKKSDSINLVAGIKKAEIQLLENNKIKTVDLLSKLDKNKEIKGVSSIRLSKLIKQAELQAVKKKTGKNKFELFQVEPFRGFNRLPKKGTCDLYFDIEGVPDFVYENGLQYLFGLTYIEKDVPKSKFFWAHNRNQEKKLIEDFLDFVWNHFKKYPDSYIFHYDDYEISTIKDLTAIHKTKIKIVDDLLRLEKFVDLFKCVKESMQMSLESYSLKDVEKFYDFKRSGNVLSASDSIDYYVEYIQTKDKKILDKIEKYNYEDLKSTMQLRNWLNNQKPENVDWFTPEKEEKVIEEKDWEKTGRELDEKIQSSKIDKELKVLFQDIHQYHRRENRPDWWSFRDRRYKNTEELIDDPDCIGGLKMIGDPQPIKQSLLYKYKFPNQEYKIKKGQMVTNAQWIDFKKAAAGTIESIDAKNRTLLIKKGTGVDRKTGLAKENLPKLLNLGPRKPTPPDDLERSIQDLIKEILLQNNSKKYQAIIDILKKDHPKIKNIKKGKPIVQSDDFKKEIPLVIENLDNSYLVLQGPPGTGKTYQIGNAIIYLLKKGSKIGVTGNSHKVIINILKAIEDAAENEKEKFNFKGLKQKGNLDEHIFNGKYITTQYLDHKGDKKNNEDKDFIKALRDNSHNIFGGTKYHFRKEFFDEKLDYLFVDECSQVSLADVVAMSKCTKNIILVGDQQQLGMPTKALHPGETKKSALEYLIPSDTIEPDKGIFLNTTRRLHPNINSFISNNFYDERLKYHPETEKRKIIFPSNEKIFKTSGLYYFPMEHENRSQLCEEEGNEILKLYDKFLNSKYIDEKGKSSNLSVDSILVISPYNVQVNYLKSILPKNSNVGTVDSFQGQQRPISILSMATSEPENLSRNLEFFYSRNRLNVGISRAQCISIVLMSPKLFHFQCKKPSQVKLVNTLIKLKDYSIS